MEEDNTGDACAFSKKRGRDDSASASPQSKLPRIDSANSFSSSSDGRSRVESDHLEVNSPDAKRIQDDLLSILDDSDEPAIQGLDSVIRSFEEEILLPDPASVAEVTSVTGESQPDLGYLLEASDDELGLPPTSSYGGEKSVAVDWSTGEASGTGAVRMAEMLGFEDGIPNYDSFELGLGGDGVANGYSYGYNDAGDFVAVGGLFDYSDENCVPAGLQWQPESLSAL